MAIGAQNLGLTFPSSYYPTGIGQYNIPNLVGTNEVSLAAGAGLYVPPGNWLVTPGQYSMVQVLDPVTTTWKGFETSGQQGYETVVSDGFNYRVINPTGCVVAALVTGGGSGYAAATPPAVTVSSGGAVATAIIGGAVGALALKVNTSSITSGAGSNFTVSPIINIAAPPAPGIQATAIATVSGGQLNGFTVTNQGGGYVTAPVVTVVPSPFDTNLGTIVNATVTCALTGSTSVTGVLVTNYGNGVLAGVPAMTIAAPTAGTQATAVPVMCLSATGFTVTTGGSSYAAPAVITSAGGELSGGAFTNPAVSTLTFEPRPANILAQVSAGGSGGQITASGALVIDGGLFQNVPLGLIQANYLTSAAIAPQGAAITLVLGNQTDTVNLTWLGGSV